MTRSMIRFCVTLVCVVSLSWSGAGFAQKAVKVSKPESVGVSTNRLQNIGKSMQRLIDAEKISGSVTLLARKGKVIHFEARGMSDIAAGEKMRTDSIFRLYSQTKPVTGVAVMMLFEEGHFLLDDPIADYLPEFKDMLVYVGEKDGVMQTEPAGPMTIHQLLTHTSGLSYDFIPTPVAQLYKDADVFGADSQTKHTSLKTWVKALARLPLVSQPGEEWNYSVGMDVLGRLVEVVSGMSYREFIKSRILEPLEMNDTDFFVPQEKITRFTNVYSPKEGGGLKALDPPAQSPFTKLPEVEMGGSGLVGTVSDYLKFAQMLLNGGEYNGQRLLGPRTVAFMMANHITPNMRPDPLSRLTGNPKTEKRAWGIGFGLTGSVVTNSATAGLPVSVGSFSWGGAASTMFWIDPKEELVGIAHTQLFPSGTEPIGDLIQQATYQAIID